MKNMSRAERYGGKQQSKDSEQTCGRTDESEGLLHFPVSVCYITSSLRASTTLS